MVCRSWWQPNSIIIPLLVLLLHLFPYSTHSLPIPANGLDPRRLNPTIPLPRVVPPHCSRATVTVSHSSRLTRRSTSGSAPQLSLGIGVGQSICFRLHNQQQQLVQRESDDEREEDDAYPSHSTHPGTDPTSRDAIDLNTLAIALKRQLRELYRNNKKDNKNETVTRVGDEQSTSTNSVVPTPTSTSTPQGPQQQASTPGAEERQHLLHTLSLVELEQYHAITERYRFAIPELETNCICECNAAASTCQADEYKYGKCQPAMEGAEAVCHRTFFANQPASGCPAEPHGKTAPRLCCQLRFRPYRNRVFTALRLEPPTTSAILKYSVFGWRRRDEASSPNHTLWVNSTTDPPPIDQWEEVETRKVRVQLDGTVHNTFLDETTGLKLSVLGLGGKATFNQLEPGMYFVENIQSGGYGELTSQPLNRITEHDFHKLGWFRLNEKGQPFVQSGDIFLDKIHHARTENCAEQKFRSVLEASYYVNKRDWGGNETSLLPHLAPPLNLIHKWIRSARVFDHTERQVIVTAGEGTSLDITLTTATTQPRSSPTPQATISFVHNSSQLTDFTATILVDKFSNSLLNLTVYGAKGVLNGHVRQLEDWNGRDVDSFSLTIPTSTIDDHGFTSLVTRIKPYPTNSIQVVCLRPDDADLSKELCRPVHSIQFDLEMHGAGENPWATGVGHCADCNQITVDGFMKFLNPANWTKGVSSVSDALMLASDIFGYLFVFLAVYVVLTKIVIPLVSCFVCPMSIFYNRSKK